MDAKPKTKSKFARGAGSLGHGLKRTLGIRPTLIVSVGSLVFISVGLVALVSHLSSHTIATTLERQLIIQGLDRLEHEVRDQFDAVVDQGHYVAEAIASGEIRLDEGHALEDFLAGTMAAVPEVGGMVLATPSGTVIRIARKEQGAPFATDRLALAADPVIERLESRARNSPGHFWTQPEYRPAAKSTVLGLCVPLRHDGKYLGMFAAGIFSKTLSEFTDRLSRPPQSTAFILFGPDRALAHPRLVEGSDKMSADNPLLGLADLGDPALAAFEQGRHVEQDELKLPANSEALEVTTGGRRYRVFLRRIAGYGEVPLIVGVYFTTSIFDRILSALRSEAVYALALLLVAIGFAIFLGRMISRPIRSAAQSVSKIQSLDFDQIEPLGRSYLREIDELAVSFNAMLGGLKMFGRYMPRQLVASLIREGKEGAGSEEREMTVMFTDIANFSSACEAMSAADVADFLNHHLSIVSSCVEAEGGTIDKFIGDAVMAFWGAPDALDNPALPACRAALAIREAIRADNARRAKRRHPPVRVRIGIHTGPLVVGDIGTPTRINYTVVGDVVNGAQRLEAAGKEIDPDADVAILISQSTADLLPDTFEREARGAHKVKGKERELEVYQLV